MTFIEYLQGMITYQEGRCRFDGTYSPSMDLLLNASTSASIARQTLESYQNIDQIIEHLTVHLIHLAQSSTLGLMSGAAVRETAHLLSVAREYKEKGLS